MFCSECGKQVADDAKFCGECGAIQADVAPLQFSNSQQNPIPQLDNSSTSYSVKREANPPLQKYLVWIIAAVVLALLFILMGGKNKSAFDKSDECNKAAYSELEILGISKKIGDYSGENTFVSESEAKSILKWKVLRQRCLKTYLENTHDARAPKYKQYSENLFRLVDKLAGGEITYKDFSAKRNSIFDEYLTTTQAATSPDVSLNKKTQQEIVTTENSMNPLSKQDALVKDILHWRQAQQGRTLTAREKETEGINYKDIFIKANAGLNGKVEDWVCTYNDSKLSHPIPEYMFSSNTTLLGKDLFRLKCQSIHKINNPQLEAAINEAGGEDNIRSLSFRILRDSNNIKGEIELEMPRAAANNLPDLYEGDKLKFSGDTEFGVSEKSIGYGLDVSNAKVFLIK